MNIGNIQDIEQSKVTIEIEGNTTSDSVINFKQVKKKLGAERDAQPEQTREKTRIYLANRRIASNDRISQMLQVESKQIQDLKLMRRNPQTNNDNLATTVNKIKYARRGQAFFKIQNDFWRKERASHYKVEDQGKVVDIYGQIHHIERAFLGGKDIDVKSLKSLKAALLDLRQADLKQPQEIIVKDINLPEQSEIYKDARMQVYANKLVSQFMVKQNEFWNELAHAQLRDQTERPAFEDARSRLEELEESKKLALTQRASHSKEERLEAYKNIASLDKELELVSDELKSYLA